MYSSAKRRRIKPYARPTSFDFNAAFDIRHYQRIKYGNVIDPYFPAVGTDEAFQVMEGEVLMQTQKPGVRRYGDHQMHVFSFANGLEGRTRTLNASAPGSSGTGVDDAFRQKADVMANLKYAGVAVTEFKPEVDVFEQGFVITVAGLNTLFNSGANTLYPGDIICADIPNPANRGARKNRALQTGIPHEKLQFVITPFSKLKEQIELENICFEYGKNNILKNCNVKILKNSVTLISGKSGNGKSTLIDVLTGLQKPSSGNIYYDNI